jgi:uncharacterized protein YrzB (UPF0473 family)
MSEFDETEVIIELVDEDGTPRNFEHILTLDYKGDSYAFLVPLYEEEAQADEDDGEGMVVLKIVSEGDEDVYEGVEDETLLETLYALYLAEVE